MRAAATRTEGFAAKRAKGREDAHKTIPNGIDFGNLSNLSRPTHIHAVLLVHTYPQKILGTGRQRRR